MKTKLVFVLTCASDKYYIEQAVIATFSARFHNPDAHIVLIVDNSTNSIITKERTEVMKYITELIVVPFINEESMIYRSRWIKTSVRELIDGDFLFIDCDTITTRSLCDVDTFTCLMGAVPDAHLPINEYSSPLFEALKNNIAHLSIDLSKEYYYFNSGVLYIKDTPKTHEMYSLWHEYWIEGVEQGVLIDQPSLLKADIISKHMIHRLPDELNCQSYIQPDFANKASILHFLAFRNQSWLFSKRVLGLIQKDGIREWLIPFILNPLSTYIPFRYTISQMSFKRLVIHIKDLARSAKVYSRYVDDSFTDMNPSSHWLIKAKACFKKRKFTLGSVFCLFPTWFSLKIKRGDTPRPNICAR